MTRNDAYPRNIAGTTEAQMKTIGKTKSEVERKSWKLYPRPYLWQKDTKRMMCVQNNFNSLSNQNLSSCSLGSFFSLSSLSARWFSHTLTHNNVIKAPIRAPNTGLCQKSSEGNIFETVIPNRALRAREVTSMGSYVVLIWQESLSYL